MSHDIYHYNGVAVPGSGLGSTPGFQGVAFSFAFHFFQMSITYKRSSRFSDSPNTKSEGVGVDRLAG